MRKFLSFMLDGLTVVPASASVADKSLSVEESVVLDAPAEVVWARIGRFGDMSWHPALASTEIVEGSENVPGARRVLTIKNGGTIHETLTARDAKAMELSYKITESVLPVSDYSATLSVQAEDSGSRVLWTSNFKRKTPGDDQAAVDTITNIFQSGLAQLQADLQIRN
ncbi:SRPBCC family protein [Methylobacillus sp.]|uniref:SRPBCC family protein n=1 Tax=Methylobacillus sp. TaxID=56818 RepID=UPI002FE07EC9